MDSLRVPIDVLQVFVIDHVLVILLLHAAGVQAEAAMQSHSMVRTGRWSNQLVRESLLSARALHGREADAALMGRTCPVYVKTTLPEDVKRKFPEDVKGTCSEVTGQATGLTHFREMSKLHSRRM